MFYKKDIKIKNYSEKTIDLLESFNKNTCNNFDQLLVKDNLGKISYNLKFEDGSLKDIFGINELILPYETSESNIYEKTLTYNGTVSFKKVWRYKYYSQINHKYEYVLIMYGSDKKIYFNNVFSYSSTLYALGNFTFDEVPTLLSFSIGQNDCVGFATSTNDLVVWNCDSNPYSVSTTPKFKSICLHNNKLFAIEKGKNSVIRYSTVTDPTQWTINDDVNGGQIGLGEYRGELNKIISHLDNIYVFRDFGISKITSYSSSSLTFSVSNVFSCSFKIYSNTICIAGENIYFLSEDGLYCFDGYKVEKIDINIMDNFKKYNQTNACVCFHNGKLYIGCYLNFSQNEPVKNNCIIEYDVESKKFFIIKGVEVVDLFSLKDLDMSIFVMCLNDTDYKTKLWQKCKANSSDIVLNKMWQSEKFIVNQEKTIKRLKEAWIKASKSFTLTISTEKGSKSFNISNSNNIQKVKINMIGRQFQISISKNNGEVDISFFKLFFKS